MTPDMEIIESVVFNEVQTAEDKIEDLKEFFRLRRPDSRVPRVTSKGTLFLGDPDEGN